MRLHHAVMAFGIGVALVSLPVPLSGQGAAPQPPARPGRGRRRGRPTASPTCRVPGVRSSAGPIPWIPRKSGAADFEERVDRRREAQSEPDRGSARRPYSVSAVGGCAAEGTRGRLRESDQAGAHRHADAVSGARRAAPVLLPDVSDSSAGRERRVRLGRVPRVSGHPAGRPAARRAGREALDGRRRAVAGKETRWSSTRPTSRRNRGSTSSAIFSATRRTSWSASCSSTPTR